MQTEELHTAPPALLSWSIPVFTATARNLWVILVVVTVLSETIPIPVLHPTQFFFYRTAKALLFLAIGNLTPLTFKRFNALSRGLVFAIASAILVEGSQALIQHGHSFHWYELVAKLVLILIGFAIALEARYERAISLGPFRILLMDQESASRQ